MNKATVYANPSAARSGTHATCLWSSVIKRWGCRRMQSGDKGLSSEPRATQPRGITAKHGFEVCVLDLEPGSSNGVFLSGSGA